MFVSLHIIPVILLVFNEFVGVCSKPTVFPKWHFYRGTVVTSIYYEPGNVSLEASLAMTFNASSEDNTFTVALAWYERMWAQMVKDIEFTGDRSRLTIGYNNPGRVFLYALSQSYDMKFVNRGELNTIFFYNSTSDEVTFGEEASDPLIILRRYPCDEVEARYPCLYG